MLRCDYPSYFPKRSTSLHTEAAGLAPPDAFGPFRVLHQIGAGALGPVFRAYDPDQDKLVAVKLFRLDVPPGHVHKFVAELQRLIDADLTHQAIAAPIAAGIAGASAYLAQDFVAADSLDIIVREHGSAPAADAVRVAAQVAAALDFAAAANVVHGALHPRDVLMSPDDTRLIGLGITRALERIGFPAPVRRPYTAPERAAGATWDRRADVFSLAALIHELLWARRVTATGRQAAARLSSLPGADLDALGEVFARGLAHDPADRFETGLHFAEALKAAFSHQSSVIGRQSRVNSRQSTVKSRQSTSEPLLPIGESNPEDTVDEGTVSTGPLDPGDDDTVPAAPPAPALSRAPAALVQPAVHESTQGSLKPSQSAVWPLALALAVGMALGFAGGYWLGNAERALSLSSIPESTTLLPAAGGPSTSESTEATVKAARTDTNSPSGASGTEVRLKPDAERTPTPAAAAPAKAVAPAPPAVARAGRLTVRSTPAGARVLVDGQDVGATPLTVGAFARGTYTVRVVRDGYVAEERRVSITAARPSPSLTVRLNRAGAAASTTASASRPTASLIVESRPSGARVLLDEKLVGTTPMLIDAVPVGAHAVGLELNGYRRWTSSVRLVAGEKNRVAASLER